MALAKVSNAEPQAASGSLETRASRQDLACIMLLQPATRILPSNPRSAPSLCIHIGTNRSAQWCLACSRGNQYTAEGHFTRYYTCGNPNCEAKKHVTTDSSDDKIISVKHLVSGRDMQDQYVHGLLLMRNMKLQHLAGLLPACLPALCACSIRLQKSCWPVLTMQDLGLNVVAGQTQPRPSN
jgi:hypothetical protein